MVYDALSSTNVYFAPLIFNEEIALSCGLIPFIYHGKKLLALGGYGIDLIPRLEAYQLLVHNTIDRESKFFVIGYASYFASALISKNVIQEVLEKTTKSYNNIAI